MPNINRNPAGVLELLNLNLQGQFPRAIGGDVQPAIEMSAFYYAGLGIETQRVTDASTIAPGLVAFLTIPEFETWALRGLSLECLNQEAITLNTAMQLLAVLPNTFPMVLNAGLTQVCLPSQTYWVGRVFESPILLPPGTEIRAVCNAITGVPVVGFASVLDVSFHRLSLG